MPTGRVLSLARFPVKSTGGEALDAAPVVRRGVVGDRGWAVYTPEGGIGSGKTTQRFRRVDGLLALRSWLEDDAAPPRLALPDGVVVAGEPGADERLSAALGRPVALRAEGAVPHHDDAPLHVVTTASLRRLGELLGEDVDPRRARANVVLDVPGTGFVEDGWVGRELRLGDVVLRLTLPMSRCVMVGAEQPGLRHDARVLRTLAQVNGLRLGLQAEVVETGTLRVGDDAVLV